MNSHARMHTANLSLSGTCNFTSGAQSTGRQPQNACKFKVGSSLGLQFKKRKIKIPRTTTSLTLQFTK